MHRGNPKFLKHRQNYKAYQVGIGKSALGGYEQTKYPFMIANQNYY
jgi:hypothetical protein